jgi:hypothetical protein
MTTMKRREVRKRSKPFRKLNIIPHALLMLLSPSFRSIHAKPAFIVGCGHSGTTLLLRLLGAHARLHAVNEESNTFVKARYENLRSYDILTFFRGRKRWVEKTPNHVYYIGEIFESRPGAKVIFVLRDGRDVAVSLRKRHGDFLAGVQRWLDDNSVGMAYVQDPRVLLVRYESLVGDIHGQMVRILDFLGEPHDEAVLRFHEASGEQVSVPSAGKPVSQFGNRAHFEYRMWQVSQPVFNGSRKWEKELSADEKVLFKRMAGTELINYGYARDLDW